MRKSIFIILFSLILVVQAFAMDGVLSGSLFNGDYDDKAMYGNYVVYNGDGPYGSIILYDIKTGTTTELGQGSDPEIYGDVVIWRDSWINGGGLIKYTISTGTSAKIRNDDNANYEYSRAHIYGNTIAWNYYHYYVGDTGTQIYNLYTGQTATILQTDPSSLYNWDVVICGNKLAYSKNSGHVYIYNLDTGVETQVGICSLQYNLRVLIDEKYVYSFDANNVVHTYEISTGTADTLNLPNGFGYDPSVSDGKYYYSGNQSPDWWRVYQLDVKTKAITQLRTPTGTSQWSPSVYKDKVLLTSYDDTTSISDIRIFDITSPSEEMYSLNATANSATVINPYNLNVVSSSLNVSGPSDARLSPEEKRLYILNSDKSVTIAETNDFTNIKYSVTGLSPTQSITAITGDDEGNAYVTIKKNATTTQVWKVDSTGAVSTLALTGMTGTNPTGIKISKEGSLYKLFVSDGTTGNVTTINLLDLTTTTIAAGTGSKIVKP